MIDKTIIERRANKTLKRWWRELNRWRWPKELGKPEIPDRQSFKNPLRDEWMAAIEKIIAIRFMCEDP